MRHTGLLVGSLLSVFVLARPALAQEYTPKQGDIRLGASFSNQGVAYIDLDDRKQTLAGLSLNYFLTESFAVNLGFGYSEDEITLRASDFFSLPDDIRVRAKTRTSAFSFGVSYYLSVPGESQNILPYLRASYIGYDVKLSARATDADGDELDSGSIGVKPSGILIEGGAHIFLSENSSVDVSLSYVNVRGGGRRFDGFVVGVGLSVWFR